MSFVYFQQRFSIMLANFSFSRVCKHTSQMSHPFNSHNPENPQLFLSFSTVNWEIVSGNFASRNQDFQQESLQTRFAAMYDQLQKSLRSDGLASRQKLRGSFSERGGWKMSWKMANRKKNQTKSWGGTPPLVFFCCCVFFEGRGGSGCLVVATFQLQPWGETLIDKEKAENGEKMNK